MAVVQSKRLNPGALTGRHFVFLVKIRAGKWESLFGADWVVICTAQKAELMYLGHLS
jgi:hypothetical protein